MRIFSHRSSFAHPLKGNASWTNQPWFVRYIFLLRVQIAWYSPKVLKISGSYVQHLRTNLSASHWVYEDILEMLLSCSKPMIFHILRQQKRSAIHIYETVVCTKNMPYFHRFTAVITKIYAGSRFPLQFYWWIIFSSIYGVIGICLW